MLGGDHRGSLDVKEISISSPVDLSIQLDIV